MTHHQPRPGGRDGETGLPRLDPRFHAFVVSHLIARDGSRVNVTCAFGVYEAWAKRETGPALSRAKFAALLVLVSQGAGGARDGDAVTNLCWKENRFRLILVSGAEGGR